MKSFVVTSGAAIGSMILGIVSSIIVVRVWSDALAAEFFQAASLAILVGVVGEAGLGNHAVHDSAALQGTDRQQAFVDACLIESARRAAPAAVLAYVCAQLFFDFGPAGRVAAALAASAAVVAVVGQSLLRGTGREFLASVSGPVGATIVTGGAVVLSASFHLVDPVLLVAVGFVFTAGATVAALWRTAHEERRAFRKQLALRRSLSMGISNVCNAGGRQLDVWIAGTLLGAAAFNSYALAAKMAGSIGVISYAAVHATAPDAHHWAGGDEVAGRRVRRIHGLALAVTIAAGAGCVVLGPPVGRWLFGSDVRLSRVVLTMLTVGLVLSAAAGASQLVLVAANRGSTVVRVSLVSIVAAGAGTLTVSRFAGGDVAAATFVLIWLSTSAALATAATRRALGMSSFATPPWRDVARLP